MGWPEAFNAILSAICERGIERKFDMVISASGSMTS